MATFPKSGDENVEICLTSDKEDKILLHSYVLALHSKWFKASLSERWNASNTATEGKNHWVYELRFDKDSAFGLLARRGEGTDTSSSTTTTTEVIPHKIPDNASQAAKDLHKQRMDRVHAHEQILGALYHIIPTFSHESLDSARTSVLLLAEAADAYSCQHIIKIHAESHLRLYRNEVLDLCASDPIGMLELAKAVQSEWVFMEAATNLISRSNRYYNECEDRLRDMGVSELFSKKRAELHAKLLSCEMEMFMIQPSGRGWAHQHAVHFFRQWLPEQLRSKAGSNLGPGYAALYRIIFRWAHGTITPLENEGVVAFLSETFTNYAQMNMYAELRVTFVAAAEVIAPILKDATRRQDKMYDGYRTLTFMTISDHEIPWAGKNHPPKVGNPSDGHEKPHDTHTRADAVACLLKVDEAYERTDAVARIQDQVISKRES